MNAFKAHYPAPSWNTFHPVTSEYVCVWLRYQLIAWANIRKQRHAHTGYVMLYQQILLIEEKYLLWEMRLVRRGRSLYMQNNFLRILFLKLLKLSMWIQLLAKLFKNPIWFLYWTPYWTSRRCSAVFEYLSTHIIVILWARALTILLLL